MSKDASSGDVESAVQEDLCRFEQMNLPHIRIVCHPENHYWQAIEAFKSFS
jgi:hypothetical protein